MPKHGQWIVRFLLQIGLLEKMNNCEAGGLSIILIDSLIRVGSGTTNNT